MKRVSVFAAVVFASGILAVVPANADVVVPCTAGTAGEPIGVYGGYDTIGDDGLSIGVCGTVADADVSAPSGTGLPFDPEASACYKTTCAGSGSPEDMAFSEEYSGESEHTVSMPVVGVPSTDGLIDWNPLVDARLPGEGESPANMCILFLGSKKKYEKPRWSFMMRQWADGRTWIDCPDVYGPVAYSRTVERLKLDVTITHNCVGATHDTYRTDADGPGGDLFEVRVSAYQEFSVINYDEFCGHGTLLTMRFASDARMSDGALMSVCRYYTTVVGFEDNWTEHRC